MADRFGENQRGAMLERYAVIAGAIGLLAFFCGTSIEQMASAGRLPTIAFLGPDEYVATHAKQAEEIDYMATGSISGRITLDPCTGRPKSP